MALTKVTGSVIKDSVSLSGNVSVGGTLTYQDVTNVDALGIGTFRTGIKVLAGQVDVGSNIKLGNAGVITATSFVGSGANLTGITQTTINNNADNRIITGSGSANTLNGEANLVFDGNKLGVNRSGTLQYGISFAASALDNNRIGWFDGGGNKRAAIGVDDSDDSLNLYTGTSTTSRLRINSDGTIIFANKLTNSSSFTSHNTNFYGGNVNTGGVRIEVAHTTTTVSGNTASASFPHHLLLSNYSGNGSADNRMCSIGFDIPTTSTHANAVIAYQATAAGTGDLQFHLESGNSISERLRIASNGDVLPGADNGQDLGSSAKRWANIYSADLQLSNEGSTNDVD